MYITRFFSTLEDYNARVVELADTPDLGSGALLREGSSPFPGNVLSFFRRNHQCHPCSQHLALAELVFVRINDTAPFF